MALCETIAVPDDVAAGSDLHPTPHGPSNDQVIGHAWYMVAYNHLWNRNNAHDWGYSPEHITEMITRVVEARNADPQLSVDAWMIRMENQDWVSKISTEAAVRARDISTKKYDEAAYDAALFDWAEHQPAYAEQWAKRLKRVQWLEATKIARAMWEDMAKATGVTAEDVKMAYAMAEYVKATGGTVDEAVVDLAKKMNTMGENAVEEYVKSKFTGEKYMMGTEALTAYVMTMVSWVNGDRPTNTCEKSDQCE